MNILYLTPCICLFNFLNDLMIVILRTEVVDDPLDKTPAGVVIIDLGDGQFLASNGNYALLSAAAK